MGDINELIAQGIKAPQVEDPTTVYGKLQAIQAQRQQIQAGQMELAEKQRAIAQTQAVNQAYQSALTVNPDGTPDINTGKLSNALATSGHGSAIPGILKGIQDYKKSSADLSEAQGKVAVLEQDAGGSLGATIKSANNDPNLFLTMAQHAVDAKHVDAQTVGPLIQQVQAAMQQDPTGNSARALVGQISDHLVAGSPAQQKLANEAKSAQGAADSGTARLKDSALAEAAAPGKLALTQTETQKAAAELERTQTQNAAQQLSMAAQADATQPGTLQRVMGGLPPALQAKFANAKTPADYLRVGQTPAESIQSDQAKATAAQIAAHNKVEEGQGAARIGIERGRLNMEQQQMGVSQNGQPSPAAQMAADGRMDPATLRAMIRKNPGLIGQINTIDPKFDEANIDNRYNTLKQFSNSANTSAGGQVLALNTMIHHADLYLQTANALKNGTFVPGNAIYNAVASAFGAAPPTNANLVARFFASETGKVATGGVPAEGEINGVLKNLGTNAGPDQIAGAGKTLMQIAAGRMIPLKEKAQQAKIDNLVQVIGPDAQQVLARNGFDPQTMQPLSAQKAAAPTSPTQGAQALPNGGGKVIDKATAQKFYDAAGGDPKKAQALAEKNNWKVQ